MTTPFDAAQFLAQEAGIPVEEPEHYTDWGLAKRLVKLRGQDFRYCWPWGKWLTWTGQRWALDQNGQGAAWCKDTIKGILADAQVAYVEATEAAMNGDKATQDAAKKKADALYAWAVKSEAAARIAAAIESAKSEPGIPVIPDELDVDPWLFNVENGTLDLHTMTIREHRREDLITQLASFYYDPNAEFPLWDQLIAQAVPDPTLCHFLQKAAASSLTGDAPDDVLLFLYGPGGAGKGTFIGGLLSMLGDYGATVELDTFTNGRNSHGPRPDLAALRGKRMVVIEEVDDRQPGVVAMLKKMSGGTSITTRTLYQDTFSFKAQCKIWPVGNKRPRFPDDDTGLWRRLRMLPFTHVFSNPDPSIRVAICTSSLARAKIFNWALEGLTPWQQEGLGQPPPIVQEATAEYRSDLDPLADWLTDNTIEIPTAWTSSKDLYTDYQAWARDNGVQHLLGSKSFSQRLAARFQYHRTPHVRARGFLGVGLKTGFQIVGDTLQESPKGEVPEVFQNQPHMEGVIQPQLSGTLHEVSLSEVPTPLDPWDEGWQEPEVT